METLLGTDAAAAAALSAGFGWPHREADWAMFLRLGHGLALRVAGRLVGTAMWFPLGPAQAAVGLVQVAPDGQGRGLGRALMQGAMAAAGVPDLVLHATAEGAGLYRSLGFVPAGTVEQWQGDCRLPPEPGPTRKVTAADAPALLALDAAATGYAREGILRPWMTEGAVTTGGDGFALRGTFGRGGLIGPVIAPDLGTACALVRALLWPGFVRLDLLDPDETMRALLRGAGLGCVGTVLRMTRGDAPAPTGRVFGLLTQALG